jgi:hypothetical protein
MDPTASTRFFHDIFFPLPWPVEALLLPVILVRDGIFAESKGFEYGRSAGKQYGLRLERALIRAAPGALSSTKPESVDTGPQLLESFPRIPDSKQFRSCYKR